MKNIAPVILSAALAFGAINDANAGDKKGGGHTPQPQPQQPAGDVIIGIGGDRTNIVANPSANAGAHAGANAGANAQTGPIKNSNSASTGPVTATGGTGIGGEQQQQQTATSNSGGNTLTGGTQTTTVSVEANPTATGGSATGGASDASAGVEGSGNSSLQYNDNSVFKAGAATGAYNAASIFAVKNCVASNSIGIGGGDVFGNYGGFSFSRVGSGAIAISGEDKDGNAVFYTVPELANLTPQARPQAIENLSGRQKDLAMCLTSKYQEAINIQIAIHKATGDYQVEIAQIEAWRDTTLKQIESSAQLGLRTLPHVCADTPHMNNNIPVSVARGNTGPEGQGTEHHECVDTLRETKDIITAPIQLPVFRGNVTWQSAPAAPAPASE